MSKSRYQESLDYLYSVVNYGMTRSYRYSEEVFDLNRVRRLLEALGNPHQKFPSIHIAGTKGKGSVATLMASALKQEGYRVGKYTSPHLVRFTERIQINGTEISEEEVVQGVDELRDAAAEVEGISTYELATAMAFQYFARAGLDYAVVEVGLGGRLDATNVLTPMVSVITSLSYDHMHLLGESLSDIAGEKAGIIKPGIPVVLAPQQHEAALVVQEVARDLEAPLVEVGRDWLFSPGSHDLESQTLFIWSAQEQFQMDRFVESGGKEEWVPARYEIPLLGYHQVVNAAVAYAALQTARERGLKIGERAIQEGFRSASWMARFQVLSSDPIVVVDCAHNRDSALKLRIALDDYFPGQPAILLFGASEDKDIDGMFVELLPRISRMVVTQADHPRSADPQRLADMARGYGLPVEKITPVVQALEWALENVRPEEVILVAGSLFVAGEVLAAWGARQ